MRVFSLMSWQKSTKTISIPSGVVKCNPAAATWGTMTWPMNLGTTVSMTGIWGASHLSDEEAIREAQRRRVDLKNPFPEYSRDAKQWTTTDEQVFSSEHVCYEPEEKSEYGTLEGGKWMSLNSSIVGPKINDLRYIENNTLSTFLFLLGYFEKNIGAAVVSKVLDKKTEEAIQNM